VYNIYIIFILFYYTYLVSFIILYYDPTNAQLFRKFVSKHVVKCDNL